MRSAILLPFLLATALAAPLTEQQRHPRAHRLGRSQRYPASDSPQDRSEQRRPHHAGRLAGSRADMRDASPPSHPVPDSGEVWDLPEDREMQLEEYDKTWRPTPAGTGLVFANGVKGLSEDIVTRAWTELVSPTAGVGSGRKSWYDEEYVGELGELGSASASAEEEGEEQWEETELEWLVYGEEGVDWKWGGEVDMEQEDIEMQLWSGGRAEMEGDRRAFGQNNENNPSGAVIDEIDGETLRIAAKISPPPAGWAVSSRGEWYLAHMEM